jgi:hypothetical protein
MKREETEDGPVFVAKKNGRSVEFSKDPHPGTDQYLVIEAPDVLVLFPRSTDPAVPPIRAHSSPSTDHPDRDAHLRRAFSTLATRVSPSLWVSSTQPYTDLVNSFRALHEQDPVRTDVAAYLATNPSVGSAVEMLFTSIAMSARADWQAVPASMRGVAARGWFLGRWVPTFLVLDGPILRYITSEALRRQSGSRAFLRAVRSFFSNRDFMLLRHAFAHWSFSWRTEGGDSAIVGLGRSPSEEVRVSRSEADAFHIITFALVEAVHDVFLEGRPTGR